MGIIQRVMYIYPMKKILFAIVFLSYSFGFAQTQISDAQQKYVQAFITAVKEHNQKKTIKLLDKDYRKEQIKFLGGNKDQFVDELFSGTSIGDGPFVVFDFENILSIEVAEVIDYENGEMEYIFRIKDSTNDALCSLFLKKKEKKYGFVGAVG